MNRLITLPILASLLLVGCGENSSSLTTTTTQNEIKDTQPKNGSTVAKVNLPSPDGEDINSITLEGEGQENFKISKNGEIVLNSPLLTKNKMTQQSSQKVKWVKRSYKFKVKIIYASGIVRYMNIKFTVNIPIEIKETNNSSNTENSNSDNRTNSEVRVVAEASNNTTAHTSLTNRPTKNREKRFYKQAKSFSETSNVNRLINSYLAYAEERAQETYETFMSEEIEDDIWNYLKKHPNIAEGIYASRFPVNPYSIKNLSDFRKQWKEDGKSNEFIENYMNVALGLSVNARESGIFNEVNGGDTSEHPTIDYSKVSQYEEQEQRWRENFDFKDLGYGINYNKLKKYMTIKYNLSSSEAYNINYMKKQLKKITQAGYDVNAITPEIRKEFGLSFDGLNVYRLSLGLNRLDCNSAGNPCQKINDFINDKGISASDFLVKFNSYKKEVTDLIAPNKYMPTELRGLLGVVPKENNDYKLMSFYDLANFKIANDEIPAKDFSDNEPNWPIFNSKLSNLPWQILALEQNAQKQECEYVKSRFFETDKAKLAASYPPHAIDGGKGAEKRFKEYTTYTWAYSEPEVIYSPSNWSNNRTVYRILQDGGVCGRQSTMGQHVNECLNRPSIGVGQPGHRAWVGVYNFSKDNSEQYKVKIGYQVGSYESATAHSALIYNHYTSNIRNSGLERFAGVVTGVSPASAGEHLYNQSMILQHIGKLLEKEGASAEAVLRKAIELVPNNVDAWYQLAKYYAAMDKPEKVIALANEFMDTRDNFFIDVDGHKGANNLEVVTGRNIALTIREAASIDEGRGDKSEWGQKAIWDYLDTYENDNRSYRSYRDQNRYLAQEYLVKEEDNGAFEDAVIDLFKRYLSHNVSGSYPNNYFNGVAFDKKHKEELFDKLQRLTDEAQISSSKRNSIYKNILGRQVGEPLASVVVNDVCLGNLNECQGVQEFKLNATSLYMTVDNRIGEDKEVAPTKQGEAGYSTLIVPATDDLGNDLDLKIRVAKVATSEGLSGKLLKINDPSSVETNSTTIIVWMDPTDNSLEDTRLYTAAQKIILNVKKRVENNEEKMGEVILNVKDIINGRTITFDKKSFKSKTYKEPKSSVYFTTLESNVGPVKGAWLAKGYATLNIPVKDDNNNTITLKLRANNNSYKMNAGQNANWNNVLKINYKQEDNPTIEEGTHLKSVKTFTIDAKMWHKQGKLIDRLYVDIDFTTPSN